MTEEVTLNHAKITWQYQPTLNEKDSFEFKAADDGAVADGDHDKWIDILAIDWGAHEPGASAYELKDVMITSYDTHGAVDGERSAGLRSDGELVQAVSDAEMSGDFIF